MLRKLGRWLRPEFQLDVEKRQPKPSPNSASRLLDKIDAIPEASPPVAGASSAPAASSAVAEPLAQDPEKLTLPIDNKEKSTMTKYKLEYIWLDGYSPVPNLRGKTQIREYGDFPTLEQLPLWGFDGSSTIQADGSNSDCVLKPIRVFPDSERKNGVLVLCEVMMPDGVTPHPSNKRATILDDEGAWFGFEQEYSFYKDGRPLGFPECGYPAPQGKYYTGVG